MLPLIYFVSTDFPTLNILYKCTQTICSLLCLAFHLTWRWMNVFSKFIHVKHELVLHSGCSVTESCPTLCNPMDCSTPGFLVLHYLSSLLKLMSIESVMPSNLLIPFSSCLQSFLASGSFAVSRLFASGSQSIGASASASVLPMNIQGWFPLGLTGFMSLQSKELLRVFSNTTVQKHQFLDTQLSLWSNSHIHTWLLEKP